MHDENFDDQEVELLDENIQPDNTELVGLCHMFCFTLFDGVIQKPCLKPTV